MTVNKEVWKSADIEVYVSMTKKRADGTKYIIRKKEIDVSYIGYPVEVFINKKLVFSTETEESANNKWKNLVYG